VDQLADKMNVGREALLPAAVKLLSEVKEDRKRMEAMAAKLNRIMADSLLDKAPQVDGAKAVVYLAAEDEDPQALSLALTSRPGVIAVLGLANKSPKLFVSRSHDVNLDCRPVLKEIMKLVGGGGGGKPDFAQGGGGDPEKLPAAMDRALDIIRAAMAKK
jgi:alanyl-tRNA synthetase